MRSDAKRRIAAASLWAAYCRRFGLQPAQINGLRYLGHEDVEADAAMIRKVQKRVPASGRRADLIILDDPLIRDGK